MTSVEIDSIYQRMESEGLAAIVGGGNSLAVGQEGFQSLVRLAGLLPDMTVLDFGCGCGRLAVPVLEYLSPQGIYTGVDIVPRLVEFCQREIGSRYANARFFRSMDSNRLYDRFVDDTSAISPPPLSEIYLNWVRGASM